jgi:hypothetical protein
MHTIAVNDYGAAPAPMEVPDPQPGPHQLLIRVGLPGSTQWTGRWPPARGKIVRRGASRSFSAPGVAGVNFRVSMPSAALERLAE